MGSRSPSTMNSPVRMDNKTFHGGVFFPLRILYVHMHVCIHVEKMYSVMGGKGYSSIYTLCLRYLILR